MYFPHMYYGYTLPYYYRYGLTDYRYVNPYIEWRYVTPPPLFNAAEPTRINQLKDYGPEPFTIDIEDATKENTNFRTALWTGKHLQLTLMSIGVNEDIGLELHPATDQFLRIEEGQGIVKMGKDKDNLTFERQVEDDDVILVPAGTWHNLINTGDKPIKLYSIYAPPEHPHGTVHATKAIAEAAEHA